MSLSFTVDSVRDAKEGDEQYSLCIHILDTKDHNLNLRQAKNLYIRIGKLIDYMESNPPKGMITIGCSSFDDFLEKTGN